ncbi:MAG: hypothetical protein NVSMB39_4240 [Candidatus Saccharimonadales bacterium]
MSRILIVEDELVLQEIYKIILTNHGHEVTVASNGLEGLGALPKCRPDLILLDIFMPQMDGREFLRNFDRSAHPSTKVIVYTNLSDGKTKAEMMSLGADRFVIKSSLTPDQLSEMVKATLTVA